jgi:hypothetical protein
MGSSENSLGGVNTRETPSAADAAVALVETLIDGCVDRETLRKKFMERFGGDKHAARTYFSLALRRLVNAGKVVVMKSGGSEVICRGKEMTDVIKEWGDLIDALTWRSERREIDPEVKTNGRIITYLVRRGWLKVLAAFLCRGAKVWAYIDDPIDLSLVLYALRYVVPPHNILPSVLGVLRYVIPQHKILLDYDIELECICPNSEFVVFVPRRTLLTYMTITMIVERSRNVEDFDGIIRLPGGQTVDLRDIPRDIPTDCMKHPQTFNRVLLWPLISDIREALPLIIRFVRVVD